MSCSRSWQIEAARDGRLLGKELIRAIHHREHCADCAREEAALAQLGCSLESLPLLARDSMTTHRERQQLMAALNDAILAPPPRPTNFRTPGALLALLAMVGGLCFAAQKSTSGSAPKLPPSVIEVQAQPGAIWSEHLEASADRIELTSGIASFRVHPHQARRVVIGLPDGEVEDIGTVFEVDVHEHQTRTIAVHEGCVSVRLHGRPEFSLSAGETWRQPESAPSAPASDAMSAPANSSASSRSVPTLPPRPRTVLKAAPSVALATSAKAEKSALSDSTLARAAKTEDQAYLNIVTLLNQQKFAAAQSAAKEYLLQFPNGFRRVEVLNVAVHDVRGRQ